MSADGNETMMGDWLGRDPRPPAPVHHPDVRPFPFDPAIYRMNDGLHKIDIMAEARAAMLKSTSQLEEAALRYGVGMRVTVTTDLDELRITYTSRLDPTVPFGQIETDFAS